MWTIGIDAPFLIRLFSVARGLVDPKKRSENGLMSRLRDLAGVDGPGRAGALDDTGDDERKK
jgi:hypothetical protein